MNVINLIPLAIVAMVLSVPVLDVPCMSLETYSIPMEYEEGGIEFYSEPSFLIFTKDFVQTTIKNTDDSRGVWKIEFIFNDSNKIVKDVIQKEILPGETEIFRAQIPEDMSLKEHNVIIANKEMNEYKPTTCKKSLLDFLSNMKEFV